MYWTCSTNTRSQINLILKQPKDAPQAHSVSTPGEPPFDIRVFTVQFMQVLDEVLQKFPGSWPVVNYITTQLHPKTKRT